MFSDEITDKKIVYGNAIALEYSVAMGPPETAGILTLFVAILGDKTTKTDAGMNIQQR